MVVVIVVVVVEIAVMEFGADGIAGWIAAVDLQDLPVRCDGRFIVAGFPGRGVGSVAGRQVDVAGRAVTVDA